MSRLFIVFTDFTSLFILKLLFNATKQDRRPGTNEMDVRQTLVTNRPNEMDYAAFISVQRSICLQNLIGTDSINFVQQIKLQ